MDEIDDVKAECLDLLYHPHVDAALAASCKEDPRSP